MITGHKRFITNAPTADLFVVFARSRAADPDGPGIAVFLVPADAAGVVVGPKDAKMGQEGAWTSDVSFDGVRVGADALVGGAEDIGYRAAMTSLARGRIHIAALAVGAAQRALDESVSYAATATQGGTPIGNFQLVQAMIADQQTGVMAGRALVRDAARLWLSDEDRRIAPSAAKLFCTEMVGTVADLAVQIHGGSGYMRDVAGRANLSRRPVAPPVRGHQRDPAPHHRRRTGQGRAALSRLSSKLAAGEQLSADEPDDRLYHRRRLPRALDFHCDRGGRLDRAVEPIDRGELTTRTHVRARP